MALINTSPATHETRLIETLRQAQLRLTPQRLAICRFLAGTDSHPTAQDVYRSLKPDFPSLSLATVYNTLEALVALGAIHVLGNAGDDATHYDANTDPHINLMCIHCHRIVDLPSQTVATLEEEAATQSGFRILGARVIYYGVCPDCQNTSVSEALPS